MVQRSHALLLAGAIAISLIAGSTPRVVGDGSEYLAQAMNFASGHGPSLGHREIPTIEARVTAFAPDLAGWRIDQVTRVAADRRRDFVHFWFYALLAAPLLPVTTAIGAPPTAAFTAINLILLGVAFWVAWPRIGPAACLLIFAGPPVWWLDKAHTEIFTVALLVVALALARERPGWALVASGMASTQNPPIAVVFALILLADVVRRRRAVLADRTLIAGALVGLAFVLLQPAYT